MLDRSAIVKFIRERVNHRSRENSESESADKRDESAKEEEKEEKEKKKKKAEVRLRDTDQGRSGGEREKEIDEKDRRGEGLLTECGFKEKWGHVFSVKLLGPRIASSILLLHAVAEFVRERKGSALHVHTRRVPMHAPRISLRERNQKGRQINEIEGGRVRKAARERERERAGEKTCWRNLLGVRGTARGTRPDKRHEWPELNNAGDLV